MDNMKFFIYKTTNLINNKFYIGMHKTENLNDGYLGSGFNIIKAIEKYGKENFKREIIFFCKDYKELGEKEKEIITEKFLQENKNNCYNICEGGKINMNIESLKENGRKVAKIAHSLPKTQKQINHIIRVGKLPKTQKQKEISKINIKKALNKAHSLPRTEKQIEIGKVNIKKALNKAHYLSRTEKQIEAGRKVGKLPKTQKQKDGCIIGGKLGGKISAHNRWHKNIKFEECEVCNG